MIAHDCLTAAALHRTGASRCSRVLLLCMHLLMAKSEFRLQGRCPSSWWHCLSPYWS